jgi:integrase
MASFRKRGDYQWQARVNKKGYPSETKTFNTRTEAEVWARNVESQIDKGSFVSRVEADNTTLKEVLNRYLLEITPLKKGWLAETNRIKAWQRHPLASRYLGTLRSTDFATYRDQQRNLPKPLSENTIRLSLAVISHLFTIAQKEWNMGVINPILSIRMPKGSAHRDRRVEYADIPSPLKNGQIENKSEIDCILDETTSLELKAIVLLAIETAMRRSEIAQLEWSRINLKDRTVLLEDTKNGTSREVPLSTVAVNIMQSIPKRMLIDTNNKPTQDQKVFTLKPQAISQAFAKARGAARVKYEHTCGLYNVDPDPKFLVNIRLHDQRHEATSRLFELGRFDHMEVSAITGHKTLSMLKRYTHLKATNLAKKLD